MTQEQLKKANRINEKIEYVDKVISPSNRHIRIMDKDALVALVAEYQERFLPIFMGIRKELETQFDLI